MGFAAEETSIFRNDSFIYLFFRIMLVRSTRWREGFGLSLPNYTYTISFPIRFVHLQWKQTGRSSIQTDSTT